MIVADNSAAYAFGVFFCNFSTVQRNPHISFYFENKNLPHLYGIKENSVLNDLNYFHVADGLPPDLGHDLFGGFTVDIVSNCLFYS